MQVVRLLVLRTGRLYPSELLQVHISVLGRDSAVGIATRYGLDSPGIESLWWRDFPHSCRPVLGPTQPTVQWVPVLSRR
jgi:hypothetical protein